MNCLSLSGRKAVSSTNRTVLSLALSFLAILPSALCGAQVDVLTQHNDNARTGQNLNETQLSPTTVTSGKFGKLFSRTVDGYLFAQPLIASGINIGGKVRNVLYVATEHDTVYAFDADDSTAPTLWTTSLGTSVPTPNSYFGNRYGPYHDVNPEIGVTGTPVIDKTSNTLYVVAFTQDAIGGPYHQKLYALDLTTGAFKLNTPIEIAGSVTGTGAGSSGGKVAFSAMQHMNRPGLTLTNGILYILYGSHADTDPYHGWVFAYEAATLASKGLWCTTPNGSEGGIWMAGGAGAADSAGNLYFETGNGDYSANVNYSDSFVKMALSGSGPYVVDSFTPFNQQNLSDTDADLGAGGLTLLPDQPGTITHLLVGAGKEGKMYLINRDTTKMGSYNSAFDNVPQTVAGQIAGTWSKPAYFNNTIYYAGSGDNLKAFALLAPQSGQSVKLAVSPSSRTGTGFGYPGATPSISANGNQNGIAWVIESAGQAILHAYNAANLSQELYNSTQSGSRDYPGDYVKFTVPTVANGKVYVPAQYQVSVYGIGDFLDTPIISPPGSTFSTTQVVTITDATPGATIYYTTNGATPDAGSTLYTGPFTLTTSATVQAIAVKSGYANSIVASAGFLLGDGPGDGDGLHADYFTNKTLSGTPAVSEIDPSISGTWNGTAPTNGIPATNWSARWTGQLLPRSSGTYTFYTTSDDGVRLYLNNQLIISNWTDHGATENSGTFMVTRGVPVSVKLEYYQGGGGSVLTFSYAAAGISKQIIPQNQFYSGNQLTVLTPVITPRSASFYPTVTVNIAEGTPGADVHYTLDGSTPTLNSPIWSGPLTLQFTATIKAMAFKVGRVTSSMASATFTYNPKLAAPTLQLNSGGAAIPPFATDDFFSGGAGHTRVGAVDTSLVPNAAPADVYQSERIGGFSYTFLGLKSNGNYIARLHFAESTATGPGQRLFNVLVNNVSVLTNYDIYADVGPFMGVVKEFPAKASKNGVVIIGYATVVGAAKSSAIELVESPATYTVSGTVHLDSLAATAAAQTIRFTFTAADGTQPFTLTAPIDTTGAFSFAGVPANTYTLSIKGDKWLQKDVPVILTTGNVTNIAATLPGGDANNDNSIDVTDFGLLVNAFGSLLSDPTSNYDVNSDFNCDGSVDVNDFGIFVNNYGQNGDM